MLEKIQLTNFVSHKDTSLNFDPGVTVFIGRNGTGKSSVIDGITFALYGKHTRGHNRNLVRRGSERSEVQLTFTADSKRYRTKRILDTKGSLESATLEQFTNAEPEPVAYGERRQMGEAMSTEAGRIIGLDYERLRVASVVQQGELDAILNSKPREFKELVNALIGIERLDKAFRNMGEVIILFRRRLKERTGYDDQDIERIRHKIAEQEGELQRSRSEIGNLKKKLEALKKEERQLKDRLKVLERFSREAQELEEDESGLLEYVRQKAPARRKELEDESRTLEKLADNAVENLETASRMKEVETKLEPARREVDELEREIRKIDSEAGRLEGLRDCAIKYLQPVDGRCPVCGSVVESLKSELDPEHLRQDLEKMRRDAEKKKTRLNKLKREERMFVKIEASAKTAVQFLDSVGVHSRDDIAKIREDARRAAKQLSQIPAKKLFDSVDEPEKLVIDDHSRELAKKIAKLRKSLADFDRKEYEDKKERLELIVSEERPSLERHIGECGAMERQARGEAGRLANALQEVEGAGSHIRMLERIRESVYNRDGNVATSMRSWALTIISQKASVYLDMFRISVSRLELTEKARDVLITCYGPRGTIDMDSLSGGEKVAIALALRLAMAYLMGRGRLDFIILDEPTTHLDEERRRSLVRIVTEAFREGLGPLSQMVIITHDSEIFENAEVDSIYSFEMSADGTVITRL